MPCWPAFDALLSTLGFVPSRTGSVITTVFGDAVLPRGGAIAAADLLRLMAGLGAGEGVVRTALSRLARDGTLSATRHGRRSAYALTPPARTAFTAAIPAIYAPLSPPCPGALHLAFPNDPADRPALEAAGFASIGPGTFLGLVPPPPGIPALNAHGTPGDERALAARAWPDAGLAAQYAAFATHFAPLRLDPPPTALHAMAGRTILIHAWRRIALKTTKLPPRLRPTDWPGDSARELCIDLYRAWSPLAESWLDGASAGPGPLPGGPDPALRFSGAGTRPSSAASSPAPPGTRPRARSAAT